MCSGLRFCLLGEGDMQCLAKSGFENSKSIGMSKMGEEFFLVGGVRKKTLTGPSDSGQV
jgi:hypothetical protein